MELIMIRHGQTEANAERRHQGWCPVPLSEKGISQAKMLQRSIGNEEFERIITSDLQRARQTAHIIFAQTQTLIEEDVALREINNGILQGMRHDEARKQFAQQYSDAREKLDYSFFSGESSGAVIDRVGRFLSMLSDLHKSGERIALVTHGGVLRAMLAYMLGCELSVIASKVAADNCRVSRAKYSTNGWKIHSWNGS